MEGNAGILNTKRVLVAMVAVAVLVVASGTEARDDGQELANSQVSKRCFQPCYARCGVKKPLFCASLCLGKCKHGKSIPDNLCNCTYTCSKFRCAKIELTGI